MKKLWSLFAALAVLAVLLAGCGASGFAGQDGVGSTTGEQSYTPAPDVVDPVQQGGSSQAAAETPSILGSTPQTGEVGAWERHRFFDVWDVGYPNGWTVDRPGTGEIVLTGAYGEHEYKVEIVRPTGVKTEDLGAWAKQDLEQIGQGGAPRVDATIQTLPALKVTNLHLPGQPEGSCPAVRVYARTDKLAGEQNYLVLTVSQTDKTACDAANVERLADALIAEVRS